MAGYDWSNGMSNNAVAAYDNGEKPISRWNKSDIIEIVEELGWDVKSLKKFSTDALKSVLLSETSWHHTGKKFRRTHFYSFNESFTEEEALKKLSEWKKPEKKSDNYKLKITHLDVPFTEGQRVESIKFKSLGTVSLIGEKYTYVLTDTGKELNIFHKNVKKYFTPIKEEWVLKNTI